ncbi:MAG: alpha/beta hydrolase fold domain-containing protein [Polyangiaceae bacterium]
MNFHPQDSLRSRIGRAIADTAWGALSRGSRLLPSAKPERHGVSCVRDVSYVEGPASAGAFHLLDVYRPAEGQGPFPVVMYVHGGGFRILSKDSHWSMALSFARRGYVVFNINYRLAPQHRFPAAVEDAAAALLWVREHAREYGGDPEKLVLAGESAGANLVTSLALCASYSRPEAFAKRVFDSGVRARAVVPACGLLQVSEPERFLQRKKLPAFVEDRILDVSRSYLPLGKPAAGELDLADPLVVLERGEKPERELPPFFAGVGTRDPVLDDTRRLHAALTQMGVRSEVRYYPGEVHAFQAMFFREQAQMYWRDLHSFLDGVVR